MITQFYISIILFFRPFIENAIIIRYNNCMDKIINQVLKENTIGIWKLDGNQLYGNDCFLDWLNRYIGDMLIYSTLMMSI